MAGGNSARFLPLLLVAVVAAMAFYLGLVSSNGARSPPARTPTAGAGEDVATSISRLGARLDTVARSVEASKATAEDTNAVVKASAGGHLRHSDGSSAPCDATVEDPVKQKCEMDYWNMIKQREGTMHRGHYEEVYTSLFGLDTPFFNGKKVLDIGCGPRGSLEWADNAAQRVCADPLAIKYGKLGSNEQSMVYVQSGAESMPFPTASFDVVATINNLDHVTDVGRSLSEIARVLRPGGTLLLIVEIHDEPTPCEPQVLPWTLQKDFAARGMELVRERQFETKGKHCESGGTQAVKFCPPFDHTDAEPRDGFLQLTMKRL